MCNSLNELLSARAHTVALLGYKSVQFGVGHISLVDGGVKGVVQILG